MFCWIDKMCYELYFNTRVNSALLQSFLLSSGLAYGHENNHDKYCMSNGYLCIVPGLLTHGCIRWVYPLVVFAVIYKLKFRNMVYGTTLSLNWYDNDYFECFLTTFSHRYSHGEWWFGHHLSTLCSTMMLSLWTILSGLASEWFVYFLQ